MSTIIGWYYLQRNPLLVANRHQLIYVDDREGIDADLREDEKVIALWPWTNERDRAWDILVEALALGCDPERIDKLAAQWSCNNADATIYATLIGVQLGHDGSYATAYRRDFTNVQESPMGFGDTFLDAMAELCKQLGYKGGKMWNATFKDLVKVKPDEQPVR